MAEVKRYVILDQDGKLDNVVIWDGETPWSPPEGCTLHLADSPEGEAAIAAAVAAAEAELAAQIAAKEGS